MLAVQAVPGGYRRTAVCVCFRAPVWSVFACVQGSQRSGAVLRQIFGIFNKLNLILIQRRCSSRWIRLFCLMVQPESTNLARVTAKSIRIYLKQT